MIYLACPNDNCLSTDVAFSDNFNDYNTECVCDACGKVFDIGEAKAVSVNTKAVLDREGMV